MAIVRLDARSQAGNLLACMTILGAYVFTFFPLYRVNGPGTAALATLPVIAFAWLSGFRVGLAAGLLSLPLNTLLFNLVGLEGWEVVFRQGGGPGQVIAILIGAGIGRLRDLREQLKEEITKRKRTEEKLIQTDIPHINFGYELSGLLPGARFQGS